MTLQRLRFAGLLAAAAGIAIPANGAGQACALLPEHASMIVMQSPAAVKAKASSGCLVADYEDKSAGMAGFQLRNLCAKPGEAMLGTYLVDLNTGKLFEPGAAKPVDSPAVRTTAAYVCSMSVRGVVPSLLPHSRPVRRKPATGNSLAQNAKAQAKK